MKGIILYSTAKYYKNELYYGLKEKNTAVYKLELLNGEFILTSQKFFIQLIIIFS